jgi:hypothetical protein
VDGVLSASAVLVRVAAPDGSLLLERSYTPGLAFAPESAGEYAVVYTAMDAVGNVGSAFYRLTVLAGRGEARSGFVSGGRTPPAATLGAGTVLSLPSASVRSDIYLKGREGAATVTVKRGGADLPDWSGVSAAVAREIRLDVAGAYEVVYDSADEYVPLREAFAFSVSDSVAALSGGAIAPAQYAGGAFAVPPAVLSVGGSSAAAVSELRYPSGKIGTAGENVLDELGGYTVAYSATVNSVLYTAYREFDAVLRPESLFSAEYAALGHRAFALNQELSGVAVGSGASGAVTYKNVIDFNKKTADDLLIEIIAEPSAPGNEDFNELTLTLTDIHDPSNYLTVSLLSGGIANGGGVATYIKGNANNGSVPGGFEGYADGVFNTAYYGGFVTIHSFSGVVFDDMGALHLETQTVKLYFDYESRALYSVDIWGRKRPVIDFDDPDYLTKLWGGFTTGEAALSIKAGGLRSSANYMILSIDGYDLSGGVLRDAVAPRILLDDKGHSETPKAIVGAPYPVYAARAEDNFDAVAPTVAVAVYKLTGSGAYGQSYELSGGKFTPDSAGAYAVVYRASDLSGNAAQATVEVTAENGIPAPGVAFAPGYATEGFIGERIAVAGYTASGGSGNVSVAVSVARVGGGAAALADGFFTPEAAGVYRATYSLADYLGREAVFGYDINVTLGSDPVAVGEPVLPPAFIDGYAYRLPEFYGADYYSDSSNPARVAAVITAADAEGARVLTDGAYTPRASADGETARIEYRMSSDYGTTVLSYDVPIRKVAGAEAGKIDFTRYFAADGGVSASQRPFSVEFAAASGGESVRFIRELNAAKFDMRFTAADTDCIRVELRDGADTNIRVRIDVLNIGGAAYLRVNGGGAVKMNGAFDLSSAIRVFYDAYGLGIGDSRGYAIAAIKTTAGGKPFYGFPSGAVWLEIGFGAVSGTGRLGLLSLNGQTFTNAAIDSAPPAIAVKGDYGGQYLYGAAVGVPRAGAFDVLSGIASCAVTVTAPDGTPVTARDGTRLQNAPADKEYVFDAAAYGRYGIAYRAADSAGRAATVSKIVSVVDDAPPSAVLNGTLPPTARVGDRIALPTVSVSDNMGADRVKTDVFVVLPSGKLVPADGEFTFTERGRHTVRYYVRDEYYNYALLEYRVEVA